MVTSLRNRWLLNFSTLIFCLLLFQCKTNDEILWKNKKQLSLKDFNGGKSYLKKSDKYPLGLLGLTQTRTDYSYKIDSISKLPKYKVQTYFKKKESALRSKKDTTVLHHEQLHFNIHELHCRVVRKSFDSLNNLKIKKRSTYVFIKNRLNKKYSRLQNEFDEDNNANFNTDSINLIWENKVTKKLNELKIYIDTIP